MQDLNLKHKLLAMTSNSTGNNRTLVEHLHKRLLKEFDNKHDNKLSNLKPLIQF